MTEGSISKDRIIISKIPSAAKYLDVFTLFASATQIKHLQYIRLQIWILFGVRLQIKLSEVSSRGFVVKSCKTTRISQKRSLVSAYQVFKSQRDTFWSDIPHEKSEIARKRKRIKNRFSYTKNRISRNVTEFPKTLKKAKTKKRKKLSFVGTDWESIDEFAKCNQAQDMSEIDRGIFHLNVKANSFFALHFAEVPSLQVLKNSIKEKTHVPENLQLLTHVGKLLKPWNMKNLSSSDTIHLLIRGFGGMKAESEEGPESKISNITDGSNEDAVQRWMINTVHIPERFVRQNSYLDELDGRTLLQYSSAEGLKEEANLPLGPAKKIMHFRDNVGKDSLLDMDRKLLEAITPEDIEKIVIESLNKEKDPSAITKTIKEEHLDGFAMMLYDNHKDFATDFEIRPIVARRLLQNVQEKIRLIAAPKSQDKIQQQATAKSQEEIRQIATPKLQEDTTNESFLHTLGFHRDETAITSQVNRYQLVAIHSSMPFGSGNVLAQTFLFWVISASEEIASKDFKKNVWESIHRNMDEFISSLPEEDSFKSNIKPGKSDKRCSYIYKGSTTVSLNKIGSKTKTFHEIDTKSREWYKHHVLLVCDSCADDIQNGVSISIEGTNELRYNIKTTKYWRYNEKWEITPSTHKSDNSLTDVSYQSPREFKMQGNNIVYLKNYVMERPESGDGMIPPSVEFKYFVSSFNTGDENSPVKKFLKETMRFACGCLNRRRNGTIYFGIADDKSVEGKSYKHGQVVGFPMMEIDSSSRSRYTDKLDEAKSKWFDSPEANAAARECIKSPVFVKVVKSSNQLPHFVMEVDIEPAHVFCKGIKFKLGIPKEISGIKSKPVLYVRDGSESREEDDERYFVSELSKYDEKRKIEEETLTRTHSVDPFHKYLAEKLCRILCGGKNGFDLSLWPILICSKPTDSSKGSLYNKINFVSNIPWSVVFDFDDEGYVNGLCKHFFSSSSTTVTSGDYFRDIENINTLRDNLRLPEQNVYIFSNGRKDQSEPHLQRLDWRKRYSPGVKSAVNFLQHRSVIPPGRDLAVFLLFSSDFDGFLDIFGEIITYFGSDKVVLICSDREVFRLFHTSAVSQEITEAGELDNCCVVGMTWEQVNDSINRLLGVEEPSKTYLSTSSGAFVEVELKVEESVDCISLLSATECEDKELEPGQEKKEFIHGKELKFYQGNRVEWWNFFFPGHVLERSCFHQLKRKVQDALEGHHPYKNRIVNIYLIHEPGSGGSTLARHILWEFRKSNRCVIIKKMTDKTASDIYKIWQYKENDLAKPVLVLIDSVPRHDIEIDDLQRLLRLKQENHAMNPMCVFLICKREMDVLRNSSFNQTDVICCEILFQKLNEFEINWCKSKILQLEETGKELGLGSFKGEHFISFMIFREGFNRDFLKTTVEALLKNINPNDNAFKLLTYIALLVAFVTLSRGSAATALPVECCSELMGLNSFIKSQEQISTWWEYNLDGPFKILLLVEPKELGGFGKQIRMAHPSLAEVVIDCVKVHSGNKPDEKHSVLANTVIQFLESKLLHNSSHAQKDINTLSVEMLTRRKRDEYEEEDSNFSPLIEAIISEDGLSYESAAAVMEKGFGILKNGFIAQQLARLYLHYGVLDKAKEWALVADDSKPNTASILHTLGRVYKQTFLKSESWNIKTRLLPSSKDVKNSIEEAFEALRIFHKAHAVDENNLASHVDIIATVNSVARYLYEVVNMGGKDNTYRYLTEEEFEPETMQREWSSYRKTMKSLSAYGIAAVRNIDELVYYYRKQTASCWYNTQAREDRTSRIVKYKIPDLFQDFSNFFGEFRDLSKPPTYLNSGPVIDSWHRCCVLALGGSRLRDILNILSEQKKKQFTVDEAVEKLKKIMIHLKDIWDKTYDDYLIIIAVHIVLAQLKPSIREYKMGQLLDFCREIISSGKKGRVLNETYMFVIMLMWPRPVMGDVKYDHVLMNQAIKHLSENSKSKMVQKRKSDKDYFQRETMKYQSMILFYAAQGKGLASVCCHCQIFKEKIVKQGTDFENKRVWRARCVKDNLRSFNGFTKLRPHSNAVSIILDAREYGISQQIELKNFKGEKPEMTEKPVSFYVGFSVSGPTVCYIKPRHADDPLNHISQTISSEMNVDYTKLPEEELRGLIANINVLKNTGENLTVRETKILQNEENIKEALLKYEEDYD